MKFIFPKRNRPYTLQDDWTFHVDTDYINGFFLNFLMNHGLGMANFDTHKCSVTLMEGTIISITSFDEKKLIFNILKFPKREESYANLMCKVSIRELDNLLLCDDKKILKD